MYTPPPTTPPRTPNGVHQIPGDAKGRLLPGVRHSDRPRPGEHVHGPTHARSLRAPVNTCLEPGTFVPPVRSSATNPGECRSNPARHRGHPAHPPLAPHTPSYARAFENADGAVSGRLSHTTQPLPRTPPACDTPIRHTWAQTHAQPQKPGPRAPTTFPSPAGATTDTPVPYPLSRWIPCVVGQTIRGRTRAIVKSNPGRRILP